MQAPITAVLSASAGHEEEEEEEECADDEQEVEQVLQEQVEEAAGVGRGVSNTASTTNCRRHSENDDLDHIFTHKSHSISTARSAELTTSRNTPNLMNVDDDDKIVATAMEGGRVIETDVDESMQLDIQHV